MGYVAPERVTIAARWALRRLEVLPAELAAGLNCTSEEAADLMSRLESWGILTQESGNVRHVVRIGRRHEEKVARTLLAHRGRVPDPNPLRQLQVPYATVRQRQVLELIAEGRTYQQIGLQLYITRETVKTHVQRLYRVLEAHGTGANLVHKAYQHGLLPPPHLPAPSRKDTR